MIKRTPQEIADFTGCYVAKAKGRTKLLFLYEKRPPLTGNWSRLYEPQKIISPESTVINEESGRNCQKDDLCPHQSEVHTHREYAVIEAKRAHDLANKVNVMLACGWEIQGGIAIEYLPESDDYEEGGEFFYQAMVRGV